jgi:preprotein translocase subunit SecD
MKTIKILFIALFIIGIFTSGFSQKPDTKQKFFIQSTDQKISATELQRSADIISGRLKSFGDTKYDITVLPDKHQIQVVTYGKWDTQATTSLITQKGALEFYETWNYKQLKALINDDKTLSTLLPDDTTFDTSAKLGCTISAEMHKVTEYLNAKGLEQKCKFVWGDLFEDSVVCVYALKLNNGEGVLLRGSDVERFYEKFEPTVNKDSFEFTFKAQAIKKWAEITKRNLNSSIALVIDDHVINAPKVTSEIKNGNCQVTGDFTPTQVKYIVAIGNNGELPTRFTIVK